MKCSFPQCNDDAVVHIIELANRSDGCQWDLCDNHAARQLPFSEPSHGRTSLGEGLTGGPDAFDVRFVVIFDKLEGDALYLSEVHGSKRFAIAVGTYEAMAILGAVKANVESRPLTFTAFASIIDSLGATLSEVVVDRIDEHNAYRAICRLMQNNRVIEVDTRPSDAFALAIACGAPILIEDRVFLRAAELGWVWSREMGPVCPD